MLDFVELSRLQFALTALYHFLFVPLTLGLSFLLVIMETLYVKTGKEVYKDMTKFWGKMFGINFALGVVTGISMEFQFGTNWSYYSHYVGDVFGAPLAIEGLTAFFLESTFVGLFFFGWERLSKMQHLFTTYLVAFGSNMSALWILVANGWMQNPVGAEFNFETMRMEMSSFHDLFLNEVTQTKFLHTVAAGYVCGSIFVLSISAYYLLKDRDIGFAKRSFSVASCFGLLSVFMVLAMGDESGFKVGQAQPSKLASLEAEWETHPAPAPFNAVAVVNSKESKNDFAIQIPYLGGLITTRSFDKELKGLNEIRKENIERVKNGKEAYLLMEKLRSGKYSQEEMDKFKSLQKDLGFGLLLKLYSPNVADATDEQILKAANSSIPNVGPIFWSFRVMIGAGMLMMFVIIFAFWFNLKNKVSKNRKILMACLHSMPLPWIAIEAGWFVAEHGRQPWAIYEVLPTGVSASFLSTSELWLSIGLICLIYTVLLVVELYLMFKYSRLGPSSLKLGKYHFENQVARG